MRCSEKGCTREAHARGMCLAHYKRRWRGSDNALPIGARPARASAPRVLNTRLPAALQAKLEAAAPEGLRYRYLRRLIQSALSCQRCRTRARQALDVASSSACAPPAD